jgi:hypothetical protein
MGGDAEEGRSHEGRSYIPGHGFIDSREILNEEL